MGVKIAIKPGVLPHIFHCEEDRKSTVIPPERKVVLKRRRKRLVEEALNEPSTYKEDSLQFSEEMDDFSAKTSATVDVSEILNTPARINTANAAIQVNIRTLRRSKKYSV